MKHDESLAASREILEQALSLPDASLVIHRRGALVEFKTDKLGERLSRWEEDGHVSWQVNGFEDHHCHLDLASIDKVVFDAAAVSCQGGRLNYTVWFMSREDVGNPFSPKGAFSVTLNRPYDTDGTARGAVIGAVFALYERLRSRDLVEATSGFIDAMRAAQASVTS